MRITVSSAARAAKKHIKLIAGLAAGIIIGASGSTLVFASVPDSNGTIHACYTTGFLARVRIIDNAAQACNSGETAISWSQGGSQVGDLLSSDMSGANLTNANLVYRNLTDVNFSNATIDNANFTGSNLRGANFSGALMQYTSMQKADLRGTDLSNAQNELVAINFSGANLTNANLSIPYIDGRWVGLFTDANLSGTDFTGTYIQSTSFEGTSLANAILTGTSWRNVVCPDGTNSDDNGSTCIGHLQP